MSLSSIYRPHEDIRNPSLDSVLAKLAVMSTDQLKAFAAEHQEDMVMLGAAQAVHAKREEYAQKANAAQGGDMPPVNQQVVQNMDPVPQMPQGGQGMPPQGMPPQGMPPQGGQGMPPQGMPPQGMPPQGMPPQGMPPQATNQLPENQGIAQLPAPNIQNMAGGGIVAFADGGYTNEDMMNSSEPVVRMADGGIPRYQGVPAAMGGDGSLVMYPDEFTGIDEQIAARKRQMELEGAFDDYSRPAPKAKVVQPAPLTATRPEDYKQLMGSFMPQKSVDPLAKERADVSTAKTKFANENLTDYDADIAKLGIAGKPQEERIGKRETALAKQKDVNFDMALIEAGLAMMQSKGRGLAGLAEGAGVGTKAYTSGIERLRLAQEKIDDARDGLDTLRRNEAFMTTRERRALKTEVGKTVLGAKEDAFKGMEQAYNLDRSDAGKFFDASMKSQEGGLDRASREKVARIGADALTARANATAGARGQLTPKQLADIRDKANDNVTNNKTFMYDRTVAAAAAKKAGKMFDPATYKEDLIKKETERLLAQLDPSGTIPSAAPTSGKPGSGNLNLDLWKDARVVTPK